MVEPHDSQRKQLLERARILDESLSRNLRGYPILQQEAASLRAENAGLREQNAGLSSRNLGLESQLASSSGSQPPLQTETSPPRKPTLVERSRLFKVTLIGVIMAAALAIGYKMNDETNVVRDDPLCAGLSAPPYSAPFERLVCAHGGKIDYRNPLSVDLPPMDVDNQAIKDFIITYCPSKVALGQEISKEIIEATTGQSSPLRPGENYYLGWKCK
jgi:hypothetical protein